MNPQAPSLENLQERILQLESQNRRFKRLGIAGLAAIALVALMGQAPARKVVEASEFDVKDAAGNVRLRLGVDSKNDTAELWLQTSKGDEGTSISQNGIVMKRDGVGRTILGESSITLTNSKGQPNVRITADDDAERDLFIEGNTGFLQYLPGHALEISDNNGYETFVGSADVPGAAKAGESTTAASVILTDPDRKILWKAP
jgi:hypothetical protein